MPYIVDQHYIRTPPQQQDAQPIPEGDQAKSVIALAVGSIKKCAAPPSIGCDRSVLPPGRGRALDHRLAVG